MSLLTYSTYTETLLIMTSSTLAVWCMMDKLILSGEMYSVVILSLFPDHLRPEKMATPPNDKRVIFFTKESSLSNHYLCDFTVANIMYNYMKQHIMKNKAMHIDDTDTECKVMQIINPSVQKGLGKKVTGFVKEQ